MNAFEDLKKRWSREAELLRDRYRDEPAARLVDVHVEELGEAIEAHFDSLLTLKEAARHSGYSTRTIRRWLRQGRLTDYGQKHAPKIRRGDLQRKPGHSPRGAGVEYSTTSPSQIVQRVLDKEDEHG